MLINSPIVDGDDKTFSSSIVNKRMQTVLDKQNHLRGNKSPMHMKKGSYGIIKKQDAHNKLVPSKKRIKDQSPKKMNRKHGGLTAYKNPAGVSVGIYHLDHSALVSDMMCEGNQITYDEQNNMMVKANQEGMLRRSGTN